MSVESNFNIDVNDMAEALADSGDVEQAKFFNTFFKALRINCRTPFRFDTQLCNIYSKLDERSKEACKFLTFDESEK